MNGIIEEIQSAKGSKTSYKIKKRRGCPIRTNLSWLTYGQKLAGGKDYSVNDMDYAIGGFDVGLDNCGFAVEVYFAVLDGDFDLLAIYGFGRLAIKLYGVFSHYFTSDYVVGQDGRKGFLVLEEFFDLFLANLFESFIGWGENGEGAFALKGFDQVSGLDGSDKGLEGTSFNSCVDDILWLIRAG